MKRDSPLRGSKGFRPIDRIDCAKAESQDRPKTGPANFSEAGRVAEWIPRPMRTEPRCHASKTS